VDAVLARVNGAEVRQSDVDAVRAETRFDGRSDAAKEALDEAVERELVRQEARRLGVSAAAADMDERLATLRERAGGGEALAALLERAEMSSSQLRGSLLYGLLREAVQDARYADLTVSDARLRRFYERNLEELFTEPASVRLAAVVARNEGIASSALERLRQGRPFDEVARQFSIDPQLKQSGGRMGWVYVGSMPDSLRKTVEGLRVGELSQPVQSVGGWYIVKLLERRPERVIPLADVRDELEHELTRRQRSAALDDWLEGARDEADISRL
jgi:foldase protein PrsA